jgi:hypothetical protein
MPYHNTDLQERGEQYHVHDGLLHQLTLQIEHAVVEGARLDGLIHLRKLDEALSLSKMRVGGEN